MQTALTVTATVQPGGKIEITDTQLPEGNAVRVIVLFSTPGETPRRALLDVLAESPGHLLFSSAADVEAHLREERDAWER